MENTWNFVLMGASQPTWIFIAADILMYTAHTYVYVLDDNVVLCFRCVRCVQLYQEGILTMSQTILLLTWPWNIEHPGNLYPFQQFFYLYVRCHYHEGNNH